MTKINAADLKIEECVKENTMCMYPFTHLHIWPDGRVWPCCSTDYMKYSLGNLNRDDVKDIWNSEQLKSIRKALVEGERHSSCSKCFHQEDSGLNSLRSNANNQQMLENHRDIVQKAIDNNYEVEDFNLYYWDFRFSNLCNMKCRTCGPELSSLWVADWKTISEPLLEDQDLKNKLVLNKPRIQRHLAERLDSIKDADKHGVIELKNKSKQQLDEIIERDINNVEHIYFAGGEPMISEQHYHILDKLIEHERFDVTLWYNTNLLILNYKKFNKEYDMVDIWKKFNKCTNQTCGPQVAISASIDAIGKRAEYIRHGTDWPTIEKHLKIMNHLHGHHENIFFKVTPVISIFNVLHMPDYFEYLIEKIGFQGQQLMGHNMLEQPMTFRIDQLPDNLKTQIKESYAKFLNDKSGIYDDETLGCVEVMFNGIIHYLDTNTYVAEYDDYALRHPRFKYVTNSLDNVRNENFRETFPELKDYWDSIEY